MQQGMKEGLWTLMTGKYVRSSEQVKGGVSNLKISPPGYYALLNHDAGDIAVA